MTPYFILAAWIVCGVAAYLLFKRISLVVDRAWRVRDRAMAIAFSLTGPFGLAMTLFAAAKYRVWFAPIDWDAPARW